MYIEMQAHSIRPAFSSSFGNLHVVEIFTQSN